MADTTTTSMTASGWGTGFIKQPEDPKDWIYSPPKGQKHQTSIDLRATHKVQRDIFYQGGLGSCTANAIAEALRFAYQREQTVRNVPWNPSRMFIYYLERIANGAGDVIPPDQLQNYLAKKPVTVNNEDKTSAVSAAIADDGGAIIRNGMKALNRYGVCPEDLWPYPNPTPQDAGLAAGANWTGAAWNGWWAKFRSSASYQNPTTLQDALKQAPSFISQTFSYWRIKDFSDGKNGTSSADNSLWPGPNGETWTMVDYIKAALTEGFPVMFGFYAPNDNAIDNLSDPWIYDAKVTSTTFAAAQKLNPTSPVFGHAVTIVAFDDSKKLFTILNSWGNNWGNGGYFYMPYDWFEAADFSFSQSGNSGTRVADVWVMMMKTAPENFTDRLITS